MSGAGRSTAGDVLEDLGWFVVDNLPPALLPTLLELGARSQGAVPRIAAVVDVRGRSFFVDLRTALADLAASGVDAARRLPRGVRRRAGPPVRVRAPTAPAAGRRPDRSTASTPSARCSSDLRGDADVVIDTSALNVHELRATVEAAFAGSATARRCGPRVVSFGFKYGLPVDADLVVDCRFLPNPHWVPELRTSTGLDAAGARLRRWASRTRRVFLDRYAPLLASLADGYRARASAT